MIKIISAFFMVVGLIIIGGSAGDCDGACIDKANSIGDMVTYTIIGLSLFAGGAICLIKGA